MAMFGGVTTQEACINIEMALGGCAHNQAEPVILSTGELVACVCISCLRALPFDWITNQVSRGHREAFCAHQEWIEMPMFGRVEVDATCRDCGAWRV